VQGFLRLKHLAPVEHRPSKGFARTVISLIAGTSLHLASLPGSSFVEEEHQLWYFLTASTCVVLVVAILRKSAQASESSKRAAKMPYSSLFAAQLSYSSNVRLRKGVKSWHVVGGEDEDGGGVMSNAGGPVCDRNDESAEEENHFKDHPVVKKTHLKSVVIALQLIVSHRLLRSWNQTGIKYADEQDIGELTVLFFQGPWSVETGARRLSPMVDIFMFTERTHVFSCFDSAFEVVCMSG